MPTYERWKYCGHIITEGKLKGKKCGYVASYECKCGKEHSDTFVGIYTKESNYTEFEKDFTKLPSDKKADHPKFLCDEHLSLYED